MSPAASARSAIVRPTASAAARLPPYLTWPRSSSSTVLAAARVRPCLIVDQLGVNVLVAAEHGQSRTLGGAADSLADAPGAPLALLDTGPIVIHGSTSTLLRMTPSEKSSRRPACCVSCRAYLVIALPALRRTTSLS